MAFVVGAVTMAGGAALGLGGAYLQSRATDKAAQMQADAEKYAADLQYQMYQQQRDDQAPWRAAGAQALSQMADPYFQQNFSNFDMQNDPGYQFRMDQGMKALQNSAAARGDLLGGNSLQAITQYGQDYASNEYQNAYNRFTNNQSNRFNRLASLAGIGQTANNNMSAAASNYGNNMSSLATGAANAMGAASIANGQTWGNALSSLGSGLSNNWMQYQIMNRMFPQQRPPVSPGVQPYPTPVAAMPDTSGVNYGGELG